MIGSSPRSPVAETGGSSEGKQHEKGDQINHGESKDQELDNSRANKLTPNTSSDAVKAPGFFERVKEEVEAIAESIHEDNAQNKSSGTPVGCFSWLNFGGFHKHGRQSQ